MCVSRCLQCVAVSLVPLAIVCMLSNILLLLPELKIDFLLEGHVTREATWATGLWGSGFLVREHTHTRFLMSCYSSDEQQGVFLSSVCLLAAGFCCLVSATGLSQGPLCFYNTTSGCTWGVPLYPGYLYNRTLWSGVCLKPRGVVQWNVILFGVMVGASGLQTVLCGANVFNSLLGLILGPECHDSKYQKLFF
uniref:Si:dkey-83h2.3 n=1 Tax=Labrus bergylta TaxID=56723 RepID=A0A3Q3FQS4_9LABR